MPNGFGFRRGGWGFGFRGVSPPWPFVGVGRGGLPRCGYFLGGVWGVSPMAYYGYAPYQAVSPMAYPGAPYFGSAPMSREEELELLKEEAEAIKEELEEINARIKQLEQG